MGESPELQPFLAPISLLFGKMFLGILRDYLPDKILMLWLLSVPKGTLLLWIEMSWNI